MGAAGQVGGGQVPRRVPLTLGLVAFLAACTSRPKGDDLVTDPTFPAGVETPGTTVRLTDFGAVGDGATDCTPALIRALSQAELSGGVTVVVPSGRYLCGPVVLPSTCRIVGEPGAVLSALPGKDWFTIRPDGHSIELASITLDTAGVITGHALLIGPGAQNIAVRSCTVRGGRETGIQLRPRSRSIRVADCHFSGFATVILVNEAASEVAVTGSDFERWIERAVAVRGTSDGASAGVWIQNNTIGPNQPGGRIRQPIQFNGDPTVPFTDVHVVANTVNGPGRDDKSLVAPGTADQISLHGCRDFEVRDNVSTNGGEVGITVSRGCTDGVVSGNRCHNNDSAGIVIGSSSGPGVRNITVEGNVCSGNGRDRGSALPTQAKCGIAVRNARDITVKGNTLRSGSADTQIYGITVGTSRDVTVSDNTFTGTVAEDVVQLEGNASDPAI